LDSNGGAEGDRTPDLRIANAALCQTELLPHGENDTTVSSFEFQVSPYSSPTQSAPQRAHCSQAAQCSRSRLRRRSFQTFLPTEMALVRGRRSLDVWFHSEHRSKHAPKQSCSLRLRLAPALLPAKLIADQARADSGKVQPHLPANRSAHRLSTRLIVNRTPADHHIDILRQCSRESPATHPTPVHPKQSSLRNRREAAVSRHAKNDWRTRPGES